MAKILAPVHPGEVLLEEFLAPMEISQYRLAKDISVPPRRINEIVHAARAVSADTALRLARYFGTSERFWLNLQAQYDLDVEYDRIGDRIEREITPRLSDRLPRTLLSEDPAATPRRRLSWVCLRTQSRALHGLGRSGYVSDRRL